MSAERIVYKTDYLYKGSTVSGSFPITVSTNINCATGTGKSSKEVILAEDRDAYYYAQKQYLKTFDGNYYMVNDRRGDMILFF
jgi:hypothetical protein